MLFNSPEYVWFLLAVFTAYWLVKNFRVQNWLLLVSSYFFYGWWGFHTEGITGYDRILPVILLASSSIATWFCSLRLYACEYGSGRRRLWYWIGVIVNLGLLGWFKYKNFFLENVAWVSDHAGFDHHFAIEAILLPAGISFYTFQGLSYMIDINGGAQEPARRLQDFAIFHAFFGQLVAGPIERTRNLLPQLMGPRTLTPKDLSDGAQLLIIGFVKKVAIADAIAPLVAEAFDPSREHTGAGLLIGLYLFAIQIYGDFSGYSDIARGTARILGINLMINFRQPYFARNITEFWDRWHISLSSWLRDYIFVPLVRQFRGAKWIPLCLVLTMLFSGLWHGASWNFVVWGCLLGVMLVIHKLWSGPAASKHPHRPRNAKEWGRHLLGVLITTQCVCLTLIFVKTRSLHHAWDYAAQIFHMSWATRTDLVPLTYVCFYALLMGCLDFPCWWHDRELIFDEQTSPWIKGSVYGLLLTFLAWVGEMKGVSFFYFQF